MCVSLRVHGASFGIRGKQQRHNDTEVEKNHNTWNELLVVLALLGYSPPIQQGLYDWELCRVALSCHFALDNIDMSMEW